MVHSFSIVLSDGHRLYAFDIYDSIGTIEVLKSYTKRLDTGCTVNLVSPAAASDDVNRLAASYGLRILTPEAAASFFSLQKAVSRAATG